MLPVAKYSCVYQPWFRFSTACSITSCKYHSTRVTSGCIAIDRKSPVGNKAFSDDELYYYKFGPELAQTLGGGVRAVTSLRKQAIARLKAALVLDRYLDFLRTAPPPVPVALPPPPPTLVVGVAGAPVDPFLVTRKVLESAPCNLIEFGPFTLPKLVQVLDAPTFDSFCAEFHGEIADLSLHHLLFLSKTKFARLCAELVGAQLLAPAAAAL